jgi:pyruvate kinase
MNRIAIKTNDYIRKTSHSFSIPGKMKELRYRSAALAHGVKTIVDETDVDFIGVWSELGGSAVFLSQCRIPQPIFAFSPDERTVRLLTILYGIQPVFMDKPESSNEFMILADQMALKNKWAKNGDTAVYISREPIEKVGQTNLLNLHYIGENQ